MSQSDVFMNQPKQNRRQSFLNAVFLTVVIGYFTIVTLVFYSVVPANSKSLFLAQVLVSFTLALFLFAVAYVFVTLSNIPKTNYCDEYKQKHL